MCCVQENEVKLCLIQEDKIVLLAPSITLSMIALVIIWSLFLLVIILLCWVQKEKLAFLTFVVVLLLQFLNLFLFLHFLHLSSFLCCDRFKKENQDSIFILLHCWCFPLFFYSYTLNPSLLLALLSWFYWTSIGMLQVLWKWEKNLKAFLNQLLIRILQMLLKGWLGMVMVELNLNQLMS
jgi:hypothetical protein